MERSPQERKKYISLDLDKNVTGWGVTNDWLKMWVPEKKKVSCALFSRHTSKRGNKDTENWKDFRAELTCKFLPGRALGRQRALREKMVVSVSRTSAGRDKWWVEVAHVSTVSEIT